MKKVIVVILCTVIMGIFILLNYLLIALESKEQQILSIEKTESSNNLAISTLSDKLNQVDAENARLKQEISNLGTDKKSLETELNLRDLKLDQANIEIDKKVTYIIKLLNSLDLEQIEYPIWTFANELEKKDYVKAYDLLRYSTVGEKTYSTPDQFYNEFAIYFKEFKIQDVTLFTNENIIRANGEIIFRVEIQTVKEEGSQMVSNYIDGFNIKYFYIEYDEMKHNWLIAKIADSRPVVNNN